MSARTVTFYLRVNSVLTDADDTPALGDATNTYGVRRRDTLDGLMDFGVGTPLVHVATGTYQLAITGMLANAPYEFKVHALKGGTTYRGGGSFIAPSGSVTEYITDLSLDLELGNDNADLHADLSNEQLAEEITTMRLDAIAVGILRTDLTLMGASPPPTFPLTVGGVPLMTAGGSVAGIIALAARKYAAGELMNKRGKQVSTPAGTIPAGDLKIAEADALLAKLMASTNLIIDVETTDADPDLNTLGPVAVGATQDACGCPVVSRRCGYPWNVVNPWTLN